jgi:hypothetical protein
MDRGRVGEDRESKETDGCPLTHKSTKSQQACRTMQQVHRMNIL